MPGISEVVSKCLWRFCGVVEPRLWLLWMGTHDLKPARTPIFSKNHANEAAAASGSESPALSAESSLELQLLLWRAVEGMYSALQEIRIIPRSCELLGQWFENIPDQNDTNYIGFVAYLREARETGKLSEGAFEKIAWRNADWIVAVSMNDVSFDALRGSTKAEILARQMSRTVA